MADDLLSQYLRSKFSSILQEADSERSIPSDIISRFRSIERMLNFMSESTNSPIPVETLYKLIDTLSECRIASHHRHQAAASKKSFFWVITDRPLSKFLKNLKKQLDEIQNSLKNLVQSNQNGGLSLSPTELVIQQTYPVLDTSRIIGFESQAEKIEDWLINNLYTEGLTAIGITGRCGCGKTALAQKVFSSPRIQQEFSPRIWLGLSNMLFEQKCINTRATVLKYILEETGYDVSELEYSDFSLSELLEKLRGGLMGKRYLIVLDDAWRVDEWYADLGHSLPRWSQFFTDGLPQGSGGGVIVTSRRDNVIRRMVGEKYVIRLRSDDKISWKIFKDVAGIQLRSDDEISRKMFKDVDEISWKSDDEIKDVDEISWKMFKDVAEIRLRSDDEISWKIFKDVAGEQVDPLMLMKIQDEVIRKCDGLPLAARTLANIIFPKALE